MKKQICIKCGRPVVADGLCEGHYAASRQLATVKINKRINQCKKCGGFFVGKEKYDSLDDALKDAVRITSCGNISNITSEIKNIGGQVHIHIVIHGKFLRHDVELVEKHTENFRIRKLMCSECSKMSGGYNEAIIQFRADDMNDMRRLGKMSSFYKEVRGGYDFYFLRKNEAAKMARILGQKYTVKKSSKIVGQKKDRVLYKDFYSVKPE